MNQTKLKKHLFVCLLSLATVSVLAQQKIKDGTVPATPALPAAGSLLELESVNKGFVPPRVPLTATNVSTPLSVTLLTGTLVYNTATAGSGSTAVVPGYYYWDGTRWVRFVFNDASSIQSILEPALDNTVTNPIALTPNDGDAYIVGTGGAGAWAGQDDKIAKWDAANTQWVFYTPLTNDQTTVTAGTNAGLVYKYNGTAWVQQPASSSGDWALGGNTNTTATNNILGTLTNDPLRFYTNGTQKMTTLANGNVGIGTAAPNSKLHVVGIIRSMPDGAFTGSLNLGTATTDGIELVGTATNPYASIQRSANGANLYLTKSIGTGAPLNFQIFNRNGSTIGSISSPTGTTIAFNTTSDLRLKENIRGTHYGIADLMKIQVKDYNYKTEHKTRTTGLLAQDLYKVYPDAVTPGGEDEKTNPWMIDYSKMTPLLVKAIQDQQAQIEKQQAINEKQQTLIEKLEARLKTLEEHR